MGFRNSEGETVQAYLLKGLWGFQGIYVKNYGTESSSLQSLCLIGTNSTNTWKAEVPVSQEVLDVESKILHKVFDFLDTLAYKDTWNSQEALTSQIGACVLSPQCCKTSTASNPWNPQGDYWDATAQLGFFQAPKMPGHCETLMLVSNLLRLYPRDPTNASRPSDDCLNPKTPSTFERILWHPKNHIDSLQ